MAGEFREVLALAYDPRGLTGGLGIARQSANDTRASMDALKRGVGAAAAAGGALLASIARDHENARSAIAQSTGATGTELDTLQAAYLSTLGNVRSSSEETAAAVSAVVCPGRCQWADIGGGGDGGGAGTPGVRGV